MNVPFLPLFLLFPLSDQFLFAHVTCDAQREMLRKGGKGIENEKGLLLRRR